MKELTWNDPKSIDLISKTLQKENIVVGSSDTVIGLLAPLTQKGFAQLNQIKERNQKPYLILVENLSKALKLSDDFKRPVVRALAERFWPGPLTLIVQAKKGIPDYWGSPKGAIAIRVPAHEGLQQLLTHFDGLFSTSANKTSKPIPHSFEDLDPSISAQVAYLVEGPLYDTPSTIVDVTQEPFTIVRQGAISQDELVSD